MAEAQRETAEFQSERGIFRAEYERELGQWLRRRLGWLCIAYAVFQILAMVAVVITTGWSEGDRPGFASGSSGIGAERTPADDAGGELRTTEGAGDGARSGGRRPSARVNTPLDAVGEIARDIAKEVRGGNTESVDAEAPKPIGQIVDRILEDALSPITDRSDRGAEGDGIAEQSDGGERAKPNSDPAPLDHPGTATTDARGDGETRVETNDVARPQGISEVRAGQPPAIEPRGTRRAAAAGLRDQAAGPPRSVVVASADPAIPRWLWILLNLPSLGVIVWFGLRVRPKLYTRSELVAAATRMILLLGFFTFSIEAGLLLAVPSATATPIISIFFWHLTASLFLPWTWRESLRPILPILACWVLLRAGLAAGGESHWLEFLAAVLFAPLLFAPALVLCYVRLRWHRNRFKSGFVGRRLVQMRREFLQARAVHESLFPSPVDEGWLRFDFGYRPAADIGGDFINVWTDDRERFHLVLLDVTGHGLASAMTVARIHGEIERLRDEHPDEGPGKLLLRLNRYFHRLLSKHRLYATAVMMTIDPYRGELRFANAGHPPAFLRSRNGVRELESTTFLLGAVDDSLFGEAEVVVRLEEGDTAILYTDGAFDARNPRGERFGLDRLREIMNRTSAPPHWPPYLMRLVETFEAGMPEDDLLVAEVTFFSRRSISSITGDDAPAPRAAYAGSQG